MTTSLVDQVIRLIDRDMRDVIVPELRTAGARFKADMISRLLRWLIVELGIGDGVTADYRQRLEGLLQAMRRAVGDLPESDPLFTEAGTGVLTAAPGQAMDIQALRLLTAHVAPGSPPGAEAGLFERYVELEREFVTALDPDHGRSFAAIFQGGQVEDQGRGATARPINEDTLTAYLRVRFPDHPSAVARRVQSLGGGFGKDTILFEIEGDTPLAGGAVMRKDFLVPPGPGSVTAEFPLLTALAACGLPISRPLWSESDPSWFNGCFIVVRRVEGSCETASWFGDTERRRYFADRLADTLARIHSLSPADLGQDDVPYECAAEATLEHFRLHYRHYRARADETSPRIEAAFSWLFANMPQEAAPLRLVHGDFGFHNMLMVGGELTAILDWEFSHFGSPAEDVSYCQPFVERMLPWGDFLDMYRGHGGWVPSPETLRYYAVWGELRNACMGVGAVGTLKLNPDADIRSAGSGLAFGRLCELSALRKIIGER